MTRLRGRAVAVAIALIGLAGFAAVGADMATASSPPPCPAGMTCTGSTTITDTTVDAQGKPSMGAALMVQDGLGNPMGGFDGYQAFSANPVCAITIKTATTPDFAHAGCLGGYPPLNATGGHPVLALCLRFNNVPRGDCAQWAVLTARRLAQLIALDNAMRAAGVTGRDLRVIAAWAHAREARR